MAFRQDWFNTMQQDMERLLDDLTHRKPPPIFLPQPWQPAIDIYETPQSLILLAELAGVSTEDIEIAVDATSVVLRGQRRDEGYASEKQGCHQLEIYWGPFEQMVKLPSPIDPDKTTASFEQGLLKVVLPKVKAPGSYQLRIRVL